MHINPNYQGVTRMNNSNPLLSDFKLPAFDTLTPEHINPAIDVLIAEYRERIDTLTAQSGSRNWATVMQPQEEIEDRLARIWAPIAHLNAVRDTPAWREAYALALEKVTELEADVGQNRALFEAVQSVRRDPEFNWLHRDQRKIVDDALRDFRLSGIALEEPKRSRFKTISTELSKLCTEFEQALMDATDAWSLDFSNRDGLSGIPESALALMASNAAEAGLKGYRVSLHQSSYIAVMTYADDRNLRAKTYEAYATRASDQGPMAGRFDNSERIEKILALRHESASMLGFANAAVESMATKMAADPERVLTFLRDLVTRAKPVAEQELKELRDYAKNHLALESIEPWDIAYAAEKLREAKYAINEEEIKPYFPVDQALKGLFIVAEHLFSVRFVERNNIAVWHTDVRYYDVLNKQNQVIAGVYLDLFSRLSKRPGAWMDVCQTRRRHGTDVQIPVAFLTCNFAPPSANLPSLLTHDDVITLFHEFGHGLHHLLTEVDYPSIAGIAGVEWDAVELPSQFMENFCWSREALDLFARHWQTDDPLPEPLFQRMLSARYFHAGLFLVRQLELALFDFRTHLEYSPEHGSRVLKSSTKCGKKYR
jgi:oligopeptidase A